MSIYQNTKVNYGISQIKQKTWYKPNQAKYQSRFSGKKYEKEIINLLSAEFAQGVVKVKAPNLTAADDIFFICQRN